MARPAEYTAEMVARAGASLTAEGKNVTGFALRNVLGGGNAARLKALWDSHVAEQIGDNPAGDDEPLPDMVAEVLEQLRPDVDAVLLQLAGKLHHAAAKYAQDMIDDGLTAANSKLVIAEGELIEAARAVEQSDRDLERAYAEVAQLQLELKRETAARQATAIAAAEAVGRADALQTHIDYLERQHAATEPAAKKTARKTAR